MSTWLCRICQHQVRWWFNKCDKCGASPAPLPPFVFTNDPRDIR